MSHSERGDYRAIRQVLLDGPDFQKLSERARFAFLVIKIGSGPTGLEVEYERGAVEKLGIRTGMGARAARKALNELENLGWIVREANILWVVGHLNNEPLIRATDEKHRKGIQRYVAGLPRLAVVRRFVESHPNWFPRGESIASGLGWIYEGSPQGSTQDPPKGLPTTENREPRRETENREPRRETGDPRESLRATLTSDDDRAALDRVLDGVPDPRTWIAEMRASLEGMGGHVPVTAEQLGRALRDYVGNGAVGGKLIQFRRYLDQAAKDESAPRRNGSKQERGRANLDEALKRRERERGH